MLASVSLCGPAHRRLKERFATRRLLRVRAKADDAAFAEFAAGDCGRAFHNARRSVVFSHFAFEHGERLVIVDVILFSWAEERPVFEMDGARCFFWLQCFLARGSQLQLNVALAASPMGAVDDPRIEHSK